MKPWTAFVKIGEKTYTHVLHDSSNLGGFIRGLDFALPPGSYSVEIDRGSRCDKCDGFGCCDCSCTGCLDRWDRDGDTREAFMYGSDGSWVWKQKMENR